MPKNYKWYKLGEPGEFIVAEGLIMSLVIGGKKMCITQHQGSYYAFQPNCPHAGASFEHGWLTEDNCLVCPLHRFRFDVSNGCNISGEGFYLITYPIDIAESGIWIGVPEQAW
jgi:nitrite reductase/ring-hydroxylating ferredoxin subunit